MSEVGMRELRHRLREYLGRAQAGESFEVTVFGRPVAGLGPLAARRPTWAQLVASGRLTPPANPDTNTMPPRRQPTTGISATEALLAERRADDR
jgi:prevent-host-death family protein